MANDTTKIAGMLNSVYGGRSETLKKYSIVRSIDPDYYQVQSLIQSTFAGTTDDDVSFFFISTHGYSGGDGDLSMAYKYSTITESNIDKHYENDSLPFSTLAQWLKQYVKGEVIIFISACGSGSAVYLNDEEQNGVRRIVSNSYNDDGEIIAQKAISAFSAADPGIIVSTDDVVANSTGDLRKPKFYVLTAARHHEDSWGYEPDGNIFADYITKAVGRSGSMPADMDKDGVVNLDELFSYIKNHTDYETRTFQNRYHEHMQRYPAGSTYPLFR